MDPGWLSNAYLVADHSGGTGVFVDGRKFASIGVAVKHWINLHGIGINVAMDLRPWQAVRPCGLSPDIMTDLSAAAGRPIAMHEAIAAAGGLEVLVARLVVDEVLDDRLGLVDGGRPRV